MAAIQTGDNVRDAGRKALLEQTAGLAEHSPLGDGHDPAAVRAMRSATVVVEIAVENPFEKHPFLLDKLFRNSVGRYLLLKLTDAYFACVKFGFQFMEAVLCREELRMNQLKTLSEDRVGL